ncbi:PA14 domain-containing protein [Peptoclostridium litorale DSM 5388]|uniref:PA14 domain-containing protein n=1 Tax=Peptoclostridium litorale DSM 5388 TaxID=1121324 RepID=A0A069R9V2_PEPLI|nr:DUF5057 domain-containing protein [Peptoclostridium litorale]KDR93821.1 hypothetical protein CLIT_23c00930 [Peptoclostridium litorale DSM 5388]SIN86522.1 PA14 domain-containing protein [Peptoclostridium litorale DSM 5388]
MKFERLRKLLSVFMVLCMLVTTVQPEMIAWAAQDKTVRGIVWEDSDEDGKMDAGEKKISGISVSSLWGNGNAQQGKPYETVVSGLDGSYTVTAKNSGNDIVIKVDKDNLQSNGKRYRLTKMRADLQNGSKLDQASGESIKIKPSREDIHIGLVEVVSDSNGQEGSNENTRLKVKVTDAIGDKPAYEGSDRILGESDWAIRGEATVSFESESQEVLNGVKYKFFKKDSQPSGTDFGQIEGWENLDPEKNEIMKLRDVMMDKQGHLTWRSYDVSHMDTTSSAGTYKWNKRSDVYMNPHNDIKYQPADVADLGTSYRNIDEYMDIEELTLVGKKGNSYYKVKNVNGAEVEETVRTAVQETTYHGRPCIKIDGKMYIKVGKNDQITVNGTKKQVKQFFAEYGNRYGAYVYVGAKRYVPKTVFYGFSDIFINQSGAHPNLAAYQDYKEASKFWGYIKVDESGNYQFGFDADDGFYGYIMSDGEKKEISNHDRYFTNGGASAAVNPREYNGPGTGYTVMKLEKDKYYPVYLEYFNWGGNGKFMLYYKEDGSAWGTAKKNWFYPSKTNTPGEYAESTFVINAGVDFPTDPGKYYIGIKDGDKNGVYGPFVVAPKAQIEVKREPVDGFDSVMEDSEYTLRYTISPKPIESSNLGKELKVENLVVQEEFDINTTPKDVNGIGTTTDKTNEDGTHQTTFNSNHLDITYRWENGKYVADPIEFELTMELNARKPVIDFGNENTFVSYTDLDGANAQKPLGNISIELIPKLPVVKILEVEPTDSYKDERDIKSRFGNSISGTGTADGNTNKYTVSGQNQGEITYEIAITKMPVSQFIGDIEDVNGKYDVIFIGNKTNNYTNRERIPGAGSYGAYRDNDITQKKADELKEFIESGQLVIAESNINSGTMIADIFENYIDRENVVKWEDLPNGDTFEGFKPHYLRSNKRPRLTINEKPKDYDGTDGSYIDSNVMRFNFDMKSLNMTGRNKNLVEARLYMDLNGDGLFKDDELVKTSQPVMSVEDYSMEYRLKDAFTGMMPWKLEVVDRENGAASYEVGYPAYKSKKLKTRVLQLTPNGNNFSISSMGYMLSTDGYEIEVTQLPVSIFNANYPNEASYGGKKIRTELNGNYDMVVLGFADSFGNGSDITNSAAIEELKNFIGTGQSVLFTHDTQGPIDFYNDAPNLTRTLKGFVGFTDSRTYSGSGSGKWDNSWETTVAFKLNKGVITMYPYMIGEQISISPSHQQYWDIDLENEDVVPWFTLTTKNGNSHDKSINKYKYSPRAHYYTFSNGNVTFSGTGHKSPSSSMDEKKLFVNTMVKAARNANHAPTIQVFNLDENEIISTSQEKLEFSFMAEDIDGDDMSGAVYINDVPVETYGEGSIKSGGSVKVEITKQQLKSIINSDDSFEIRIEVKDSKGAMAQENSSFTIQRFANPTISIGESGNANGYLVGDTANITMSITAQGPGKVLNRGIEGMDFSMNYDSSAIVGDSSWTGISNVSFDPDPSPEVQEKRFNFSLERAGEYTVENSVSYNCPEFSALADHQSESYSYPVNVRSGVIDVKVVESDGSSFENARVKIEMPDGSPRTLDLDRNGRVSFENMKSGRYEISIEGLPEEYIVNGDASRVVNLSYENNISDETFELIDKGDVGLEIEVQAKEGCLVGDKIDVNMKAVAHNEDSTVSTDIENIEFKMSHDKGISPATSLDWKMSNIIISGDRIFNNNQENKFQFTADSEGDFSITGAVTYDYFENLQAVRSATKKVTVRSGRMTVTANTQDGLPYKNIPVAVNGTTDSGEPYSRTLSTDETGKAVMTGIPSGNYKVELQLPGGMVAEGGNLKSVRMDYSNSEQDIEYNIYDKSGIDGHGRFTNGKVLESAMVTIPAAPNFKSDFGAKFKFYGSAEAQDVRFNLDRAVTSVDFTLYRVDSAEGLEEISGIEYIWVTKTGEVEVEETLTPDQINERIANGTDLMLKDGRIEIKLKLPESSDFENNYIIKYSITNSMEKGDVMQNRFIMNGEMKPCDVNANSIDYTYNSEAKNLTV